MKTYVPGHVQSQELRTELLKIVEAANREEPFLRIKEWNAEPPRVLPRMVVYADGTNWNPGSGEGYYGRNSDNDAWVFLG